MHRFPPKTASNFRAWVRFVQAKRQDFCATSVHPKSSLICDAHFRETDYNGSDLMEHRFGYRCKQKIRLKSDAVPSIHAVIINRTSTGLIDVNSKTKGGGPSTNKTTRTSAARSKLEANQVTTCVKKKLNP